MLFLWNETLIVCIALKLKIGIVLKLILFKNILKEAAEFCDVFFFRFDKFCEL